MEFRAFSKGLSWLLIFLIKFNPLICLGKCKFKVQSTLEIIFQVLIKAASDSHSNLNGKLAPHRKTAITTLFSNPFQSI